MNDTDEFSLKKPRGLAAVSIDKRREIARLGGIASHKTGKAHRWTPQEAAGYGHMGGIISNGGRGKGTRPGEAKPPAKIVTLGTASEIAEPAPAKYIARGTAKTKSKKTAARKA